MDVYLDAKEMELASRERIVAMQTQADLLKTIATIDQKDGHALLLAELGQPFPQRLGRRGDDFGPALAGTGVDETKVGFLVGTIQTDDQVIGCGGVHTGLWVWGEWFPADLTRRRQYRRVVMQSSNALLSSR